MNQEIIDAWLKETGYSLSAACIYRKNDITVFIYPWEKEIVVVCANDLFYHDVCMEYRDVEDIKELLQGKETYAAVRNSFERKKIENLLATL